MSLTPQQLEQFAADLVNQPELWQHVVRHADGTCVYEQVWDDPDVNAWVICWGQDQDTGFHDHDGSAAAILVIEGHVREERLRLGAGPEARVVGPAESVIVPPTAVHRVLHAGSAAVTIHAYSPPLRRIGSYRIAPDGQLERVAQSYEQARRAEPALS